MISYSETRLTRLRNYLLCTLPSLLVVNSELGDSISAIVHDHHGRQLPLDDRLECTSADKDHVRPIDQIITTTTYILSEVLVTIMPLCVFASSGRSL